MHLPLEVACNSREPAMTAGSPSVTIVQNSSQILVQVIDPVKQRGVDRCSCSGAASRCCLNQICKVDETETL